MRLEKVQERKLEKGLVVRAKKGEKEAFRELVERYQERAFHIANEVLRSEPDAEDVVQEAFAKAYISLKNFKFQSSFYTWLYRIIVNLAIDEKRRRKRKGGEKLEFIEENLNLQGADASDSVSRIARPDEMALRSEQARVIRAGMDELSHEHRTVIQLREMDSLSYDEIAEATGVSRGTVMSRLHYARKRLQEFLESYRSEGKIGRRSEESVSVESPSTSGGASVVPLTSRKSLWNK